DWCTWCHKLDHEVFTDERVKAALKDVLPIRVNAEKGNGRRVAARYNVRGLPTLLFVNADGNVVKRSVGFVSADGFLKLLGQLPGSRI
ncbi:MAG: thioredoxin family protein, partial [Thermoanaerobaculia bacterium]